MASRGVNKAILLGNMGQDPEVRYTGNGSAVANVNIATTEQWKDRDSGEQQEKTEWHRIVFFGRLAEIVGEYLRKGSQIYVEGRLQTRKWQDKEGNDKYTTEIVANEMQMLGGGSGGGTSGGGQSNRGSGQSNQQSSSQNNTGGSTPPAGGDPYEDDIPF